MFNWREHDPRKHIRKLKYVMDGFKDSWETSSGFRLHFMADMVAFGLGGIFTVSFTCWLGLMIVFTLKTAAEPFNSAIEELVDELYERNHNLRAKRIKDFAALGVFATVIGSVIIWAIIFIPELYEMIL